MNIGHFLDFMKHARPLDVKEVTLMLGVPIESFGMQTFEDTQALIDDYNNVYAIGGVESLDGKHYVWMLCTVRVDKNPIKFLRFIKEYYKNVIADFKEIENMVWLGNRQHVNWLKWMGAEFCEKTQRNGHEFQRFVLKEFK